MKKSFITSGQTSSLKTDMLHKLKLPDQFLVGKKKNVIHLQSKAST